MAFSLQLRCRSWPEITPQRPNSYDLNANVYLTDNLAPAQDLHGVLGFDCLPLGVSNESVFAEHRTGYLQGGAE